MNFYKIYLLPKNKEELATIGVVLYLLGLFVTACYFLRFDILSLDFLKPQAIILGIYVWFYAIFIPRTILLLLYQYTNTKQSFLLILLFLLLLILLFTTILLVMKVSFIGSLILAAFCASSTFLFYFQFSAKKFKIIIPNLSLYILLFCSSLIFSFIFFPNMPNFLGGAQPVKVKVITKDSTLLMSRFSKSTYLLYETENECYFIEKVQDSATKIIFDYKIKRISKSEIKKIEYTKTIWQPF